MAEPTTSTSSTNPPVGGDSAKTKVFLLGITGYIGGTVFNTLYHSGSFTLTVLVRSESAASTIREKYPNTTVVLGDLDSLSLLQQEAAKATIVVNAANVDHVPCIAPLLAGLSQPLPDSPPDTPRFLIHTSGTSILNDSAFGTSTRHATTKIHRDADQHYLHHGIPDTAWHRDVDKAVLFAAPRANNVHVAIVCPPCIYGLGTGPGKTVSWQLPQLIKHTVRRGKAFTVAAGDAVWGNVHVVDLADVYLRLARRAKEADTSAQVWDANGYYFAASGEHHWGDAVRTLAHVLKQRGHIASDEIDRLSKEEIVALGAKTGPLEWGCNSRGIATHARDVLGWVPEKGELGVKGEGEWAEGQAVGVGRKELEDEVKFFEEGLVN